MTLVVAGVVPSQLFDSEIFVVSDSVITSDGRRLLSGFTKVHECTVRLMRPYFVGEFFHGYKQAWVEVPIFVAVAGSTLAAQHVFSHVQNHLKHLRISCEPTAFATPIKYRVNLHCEPNFLDSSTGLHCWSDDTFLPRDFEGLLTADVIMNAVTHSIKAGLHSVHRDNLDVDLFEKMRADFIVGARCPVSGEMKVCTFDMAYHPPIDGGYASVDVVRIDVDRESVAVIGMAEEFAVRARLCYSESLASGVNSENAMLDFVNAAVDEVARAGPKLIDRPIFVYRYGRGGLRLIKQLSGT